jgi:hypothetical protein
MKRFTKSKEIKPTKTKIIQQRPCHSIALTPQITFSTSSKADTLPLYPFFLFDGLFPGTNIFSVK